MKLDYYNTIAKDGYGEYKERGSKFLAYAIGINSRDDIPPIIERIKALHPKARHLCFAFRLGIDGEDYRANDDGEPSGSAGVPILNQLKSANLTNVFVGVIRYFGGTKLGIPGLIHAYKVSTEEALEGGGTIKEYLQTACLIKFDYAIMGDLMNHIKAIDFEILEKKFEMEPSIMIGYRKSQFEEKLKILKSKLLKLPIEMINDKTEIKNAKFIFIENEAN